MKTHVEIKRIEKFTIRALALMMLMLMVAPVVPAQAPPNPIPAQENILAGALIIPMDNVNQGNAGGTTFNLRAYGLANLFLQNNIPVKWAIKPGKSKDDTDFSANVTRVTGAAGVAGPADVAFAGGPFILTREYDTAFVENLINTFNGAGTPVTVYRTNADALVDVRYTLRHKPKIAVGPDGGNFGGQVFEGLFTRAGIPNYELGVEDIDSAGKCFTLATQGHQESATFVSTYRQFVQGGGNLILQCASIPTFENHPNGHFQTTGNGYTVFTSNPPTPNEVNSNAFAFPEGWMPFNQFIGLLADQDGEVTEYQYAPGAGPANGNRVSATNTGADANKFVATVSQVNGPNAIGGVVFEMGGHNYARLDSIENDTELAMLNGQRMQLNSVFVPAATVCTQPQQSVIGFKWVRRTLDLVPGGPPLSPGDTVEWTINYLNLSQVDQYDFQIQDIINEFNEHLIFVPGSVTVTVYNGAEAEVNPAFTGSGSGNTLDLLAPGAFLPTGGRIRVRLSTQISPLAPSGYVLFNQTTARSTSLAPSAATKSDAIDVINAGTFSSDPPTSEAIPQVQNGAIIDPTRIQVLAPTAADVSVEGSVIDQSGAGIRNAIVSVTSAATGEVRSARTNSFGFFRVSELEAGGLYVISVRHKAFRFGDPMVVTLGEDMAGLSFTGREAKGNNLRPAVLSKSRPVF